ncbi:ROK family protein [Klebsiella quasipneumoniae subsp. similipneumoniae]|uniref:N-acetylmannosamine kinase n=1 Tax=Klebsiella quasipneumoniae TaxID=1463165 RepID=UPI0013FD7B71|nr:N-acetylmannosamine kinase [Klebsiella quasipneumoniae]NHJ28647.1 ROK family protein [Klebsiella quasipneumoniae subsp. similipneumoniae]NHJ52950.1 ROK family protein [Klebsiella quasipneumoniae subsp. similipneumoniae]NHJ66501.1 ROK family protein [Klebsiella quasipneumoniae subsp. similipneumoniae]NHJ70853.1 ROK family protein [Klebsiella quasipneumoniae subsp. similipneumoniae]NHJ81789.1 ROK family protein [Klebsiella quasipneumoniae subsp. similipneumoniae]
MTTLAIDIGGTKLAAALVTYDLLLCDRRELPTPASKTADALNTALEALVRPLCMRAKRVAIASTGIIREGNLIAINPQNLGGLMHFPLVKTLREITGLPTLAINDAQAAAWAEYQAMADKVSDMAFITVSTGVGGGVVSNGTLLTGAGGLAGHLGHSLADPDGPLCGCGRVGCVEAIASGRGIAAAATDDLCGLDAKSIFTFAAQGHPQARLLIQHSAQTLARMIADLKALTDCQCVVIGGSIGLADGYLPLVKDYLAQEPSIYQVPLCAAHYRHDAGLLGAALWGKERSHDNR